MASRVNDSAGSAVVMRSANAVEDLMRTTDLGHVLHAFTVPLALGIRPVCVVVAVLWLIYRAYQVLNKPLDDLALVLGHDVPSTPIVNLAGVSSDAAIIHWTAEERPKHRSSFRFEVYLNGAIVDHVSGHENAVTITGLLPSTYYVVRVSLVNLLDLSARSAPIRFRTKPRTPNATNHAQSDHPSPENNRSNGFAPRLQPYRDLDDILPAGAETSSIARDVGLNVSQQRNSISRRISPAEHLLESKADIPHQNEQDLDSRQSMQVLTEMLESIRQETAETERATNDDEAEESRTKEDMVKERDNLRQEVTKRETQNRNLKKEVSVLERQNTAAHNERTKHERLLKQKEDDRQRLRKDTERWTKDAALERETMEEIKRDKANCIVRAEEERHSLHMKQEEELSKIRVLDEEIRVKTAELKKIDDEVPPENFAQQRAQHEEEEDRRRAMRMEQLRQEYGRSYHALETARSIFESIRRPQDLMNQFTSPPSTQERFAYTDDYARRHRAPSGHSSESPGLANFAGPNGSPFANTTATIAPFSQAGIFSIPSGSVFSAMPINGVMSDEDRERLTGGAPMSPDAGAGLLPADLFNGDGDVESPASHVPSLPGLGAIPGLAGGLNGVVSDGHGPASPISGDSPSSSAFASPRGSIRNITVHTPDANGMDTDRRSIRSNRSNRAFSLQTQGSTAPSRFSSIFGLKPRAKNVSIDDGLALGQAQSHSMPRQDPGLTGLSSLHRKRNSSLSGPSSDANSLHDYSTRETQVFPRKSGLGGFFSRERGDGWPSAFGVNRRPVSPRPGSTHSTELPRPSQDNHRWGIDAWPLDAANNLRNAPPAFGAGYSTPQVSRFIGSRLSSRRPSAQLGASGPPEDIPEDVDFESRHVSQPLAPIGTRPKALQHDDSTDENSNLNPLAMNFRSIFTGGKGKEKAKNTSTERGVNVPVTPGVYHDFDNDESPPASRKSRDTRDTRSFTGTESSFAESSRNSQELTRTPSHSTSDAFAPSPLIGSTGKESFMQKITRKSSSSKFSLPTFKREKNRLDPSSAMTSPAVPSSMVEDDEDPLSASVSSLNTRETSKSGRNWSTVLKIGKKKGNETPSLSSLASIDDDDEVHEEVTTPSLGK